MALTLGELADRVGARVEGDRQCEVSGVSTLQGGQPGTISFLANPRYRRFLSATKASAVILAEQDVAECPVSALVSDQPYVTYARVAALLYEPRPWSAGIHPSAVVDPNARVHETAWIGPHCVVGANSVIGASVFVGPGCVIGDSCSVGEGSRLISSVSLCDGTHVGRRALIHPGVVIGSDGFGIAHDGEEWIKVPQLGCVRIGDDVEIGANTTIDRGALEDTVLEDGVKLDNQIQVAHNVKIGAHTAIAGCSGIAGSTRIGKNCAIGGRANILGHLEIADGVQITATSFVTKSIKKPGVYSSGTPLEPNEHWRRNFARFRQLDEMARRLRALEKKIEAKKS